MTPLRLLFLSVSAACSPALVAKPLPDAAQQRLEDAAASPEALGELVYQGRVQHRGDVSDALFHYERRVAEIDGAWVGSHLTLDLDGAPVLLHVATYDAHYQLSRFEEIHAQTGLHGAATVHDGGIDLSSRLGAETVEGSEHHDRPYHVGPTLFGFVLENWDELVEGETLRLRFVVLDAGRTYGFALRLDSTDSESTTFRMVPTSAVARLAVAPMHIVFDTATREPVLYEGLVPPLVGDATDLQKLDARVDYASVSEAYR